MEVTWEEGISRTMKRMRVGNGVKMVKIYGIFRGLKNSVYV